MLYFVLQYLQSNLYSYEKINFVFRTGNAVFAVC